MNQNLEKSWNVLYEKYPNLFINKDKSPAESPMCFGIECNLGWYDILSAICWNIKQHEDNIRLRQAYKQKQDKEIQKDLSIQITGEDPEYSPVKFDQIKEKFGGLRVYFSGGDDYVEGVVKMAEEMSYKICEVCGNAGKPNENGWITTLCENCRTRTNS